ncbi:hypothetical protein [Nocardia jinanensis]|uniref:Uncharacterized protein n=1 Tax=Nocardia jinanensis TaxID=382504 RepID=A0A917VMC2_9NOCA|nr:hypothetical protein [Nocardia jinanensis]GGK95568.1 hypothetical protein GCM10011588_07450 [Nocardia jinanensis]
MTMPATGTGLDRLGPPGPRSAAARCRTPNPAGSGAAAAADVHWPDPSPLHHWWTEVMDGALLPRRRRAA